MFFIVGLWALQCTWCWKSVEIAFPMDNNGDVDHRMRNKIKETSKRWNLVNIISKYDCGRCCCCFGSPFAYDKRSSRITMGTPTWSCTYTGQDTIDEKLKSVCAFSSPFFLSRQFRLLYWSEKREEKKRRRRRRRGRNRATDAKT